MMVHCAGCERPILDRFLLNVLDRAWHIKCVQCCECKCNLTEKCFSREGKLYCKNDFFRGRLHPLLLSSTPQPLSGKAGGPGGTEERGVNVSPKSSTPPFPLWVSFTVSSCTDRSLSPDLQDPMQDDTKETDNSTSSDKETTNNENEEQNSGTKRRGPRTTIKAKQLETLKAAFATEPIFPAQIRCPPSLQAGQREDNGQFIPLRLDLNPTRPWGPRLGASRAFRRGQRGAGWGRSGISGDQIHPFSLLPTDYQGDYYGPGGNYDFFPHGPPSQAQSPADSSYLQNSGPGSTPLGPLEPPLSGHHSSENQRYTDMISPPDTPSPEPGMTGSLHPIPGEVFIIGGSEFFLF
ncbi:LIM/homeobox protein Lhx5 [Geospiza fortis]|uniref:LIM/homeobox protein Lhx5 n=1 Tax=Geospiza fortis TaxID=48883 RepID=A0A8N5ESL1_GEOFO|nr:LIM/homeobox protein Lhx5 [Geospiza fortis]